MVRLPQSDLESSPANTAQGHLTVLRDTIGRILGELPRGWGSVTQIAEDLKIERTLAWKLSRIGSATDPFAVVQHLPGDRAMQRVWTSCSKAGIRAALIAEAKSALMQYRALETHADDRASMNLLMGGQATFGRQDMDLAQRRAAFRANSYFLGVSAQMLYDSNFLTPSSGSDSFIDVVSIRGYRGFSRLRTGVAWPLATTMSSMQVDGKVHYAGEALTPDAIVPGVSILKQFSSSNLPEVTRMDFVAGSTCLLEPPGVGKQGAMDVYSGGRFRQVAQRKPSAKAPNIVIGVRLKTPCRIAVIEQFIHRDLFGPLSMSAFALSLLFGEGLIDLQTRRGLDVPLFESIEHLGRADRAAPVRNLPNYRSMSEFGAEAAGCSLGDMDLYRLTLEYPPEPTMVVMSAPFPDGAN